MITAVMQMVQFAFTAWRTSLWFKRPFSSPIPASRLAFCSLAFNIFPETGMIRFVAGVGKVNRILVFNREDHNLLLVFDELRGASTAVENNNPKSGLPSPFLSVNGKMHFL
jgi:hypothetical protein